MLINELREGTRKFTVQSDGSETVSVHPPTSIMLRAANRLQEVEAALQGAVNHIRTLEAGFKIEEAEQKDSQDPGRPE